MSITIDMDLRQFEEAIVGYMATTKRSLPEVLNQRMFNIAGRAMDAIKPNPGSEQETRAGIRRYLNETVATSLKIFKRGKRKGRFGKKGSRANQLARVNLIIQSRRAKSGKKGLYGQEMSTAEGKFKQAAQVGVGFLKSPFIPIIKGLIGMVKFKKVKTQWGRISVWPGSRGYGRVQAATATANPKISIQLHWNVKGQPTKVSGIVTPILQKAFNDESKEMMRHVAEKLQSEADKINSR